MKRERVLAMLANSHDIKRRFLVKNLYLFGSIARREDQEGSDVDVLVELEKLEGMKGFGGIVLINAD